MGGYGEVLACGVVFLKQYTRITGLTDVGFDAKGARGLEIQRRYPTKDSVYRIANTLGVFG